MAWQIPHDRREYSEARITVSCDTLGCPGTVRMVPEDWHDNDPYYCRACVLRTIAAPHPVADWPTTLPPRGRLSSYGAIAYAAARGLTLHKYADPTEGAREGLTITEALEIAREDPSLIYLDTEEED